MSYRTNYDFTVIKVPMSRIPENRVETILASCNSLDSDCKVIFLVRKPRAVIPSLLGISFFNEKGDDQGAARHKNVQLPAMQTNRR